MIEFPLTIAPPKEFSAEWLKEIFEASVAKSSAVGKDGMRIGAFRKILDNECSLISRKVNSSCYEFTPYREKLIARGATRCPRQISIPTIRDRLTLRASLEYLKHHLPTARPRPPHVYIKHVKSQLRAARQNSSFLRMDIKDFYPSIRHDLMQQTLVDANIPKFIVSLIMTAIRAPTGDNGKSALQGIPQGLSISNILSSAYLTKFDQVRSGKFFYLRYVDDILVIAESEKITRIYEALYADLANLGLSSHPLDTPGKTEEKRLSEGVQYLGYEISPNKISIRHSSVSRMFTNLSKVFTNLRYSKEREKHLFRLNLKITGCVIKGSRRGWMMFFSQTENISQLHYIDKWIEKRSFEVGLDNLQVKSLRKSYYEIRFNLDNSSYIPKFDNYSHEEKVKAISLFTGKSIIEVNVMDIEYIEKEFERIISREISELERDMVDAFS